MRRPSILLAILVVGCASEAPDTSSPESHDDARSQKLEPGSTADFAKGEPFQQVSLLIDTPATSIEASIDGGAWHPVEVTWSEGVHKVGRVLLREPATRVALRANEPWSFGEIQFHDEVVASDVLARDLPLAKLDANPSALAPADLVISRAEWGARDPNKICGSAHDPYRMAIHHTASPDSDGGDAASRMRQMQAFHIDTRGWCDIGYHFVVSQAGDIYQGRSDEQRTGAHVGGQNAGNIGVSLIGNYEEQQVGDAQFNATAEIVGWVARTYDIPFNRTSIKGHREHDGQSTNCPGVNMLNRLEEMIELAENGDPTPATPLPANFEVRYLGELTDLYQAGSSSGKPDFFAGDELQAEIRFKNTTGGPARNVQVGYWFESPHLSATNYVIETDAPALDGRTFVINDADDNPDNPARDGLGEQGTLGLYAMAAGETKRVLIDLEVGEYSIGAVDHPDVRGWVRNVDDLYGEQSAFDMDPTNANVFEALLQDFAQLDVLSRHEWQFDAGEPEQTEGWSGCSGVSPQVDPDRGAMVAEFGAADCVEAPAWTLIDAQRWDQLVLRISVAGTHKAAIHWAPDGIEFSEDRVVSFEVDEDTSTYVLPLGEHDNWAGEIVSLRITPALDGTTEAAIDAVFVQSSDGDVGSARETYVPNEPVSLGEEPVPPRIEDQDDDLSAVDRMPADRDEYRVKKGCATASSSPVDAWWLLAFALLIRRRRS